MSEKQVEDMKRICLMCGCHTNQTINIYEPRNGPNIVQLIHAKFKFQPINEDKYLCFSCNNWLINWHSLENINKETGANESGGKSRSRINDAIPEEEEYTDDRSDPISNGQHQLYQSNNPNKKRNGLYFSERPIASSHRIRKLRRKFQTCSQCGRPLRKRFNQTSSMQKPVRMKVLCKRCSNRRKWQRNEVTIRWRHHQANKIPLLIAQQQHFTNLVNYSRYRPLIDGKVVAMLRRVGTTLTRESDRFGRPTAFQRTFETATTKSETRKLDENEILIDFNMVLSEALPFRYQCDIDEARKDRLVKFDFESIEKGEEETTDRSIEAIYNKIPRGVTISLVQS